MCKIYSDQDSVYQEAAGLKKQQKKRKNSESSLIGRVLTRTRTDVLVENNTGGVDHCRIPGKGKAFGMPVPGDRVRYNPPSRTKDGWVLEILERKTLFQRYVFGRIKEIAANMDQAILIATPIEPNVSQRLVDRMLVGAEEAGMETVIVVNKADLLKKQGFSTDRWIESWINAGYPVKIISAFTGEGLAEIEDVFSGKDSLLAGASGVGKSTLLNALISDLALNTASISEASGRGVHTTTFTRLFPYEGGCIADSPGIREFYPVLQAEELKNHFPEFQGLNENCDYRDCAHMDEPGCRVREAAGEGSIHPRRYESYRILYQSLLEGPKKGRTGSSGRGFKN